MKVDACDRCKLAGVTVVKVLGHDLCVACQGDFEDWLKAGQVNADEMPVERANWGRRWRQVEAIIRTHGHVTSALLSAASGLRRPDANWYLHTKKRTGHLTFHGKGVFTLPKAEAAE